MHDGSHAPGRIEHSTDGFSPIAWTILTSALLAVVVWTVLGPPDHPAGPNLHFRNLTAAVR